MERFFHDNFKKVTVKYVSLSRSYNQPDFHRFSGASAHYYVKDFLQSVAERYKSDGRGGDFVLDLLKLQVHVPKLLSIEPKEEVACQEVQSEFKRFLQDFIRRNALKHAILAKTNGIMVR